MPTPILDQIATADRVLILGYAREGQSTHRFLVRRFPHLYVATADQKDSPDYLKKVSDHQIIIKSPGVSPFLPEVAAAIAQGKLITSQTQIFFELCPAKIIGVTGTKGKSTTASLIHHVITCNRQTAVLVGNIGTPPLDHLDHITAGMWVVMELSSYQLMDLGRSPHIAVLLNIYPDHLDFHQSYAEYTQAKYTICRFQTPHDYFVYDADNPAAAAAANLTSAHKLPFSRSHLDPQITSRLPGSFNKANIFPAVIIGQVLGLTTAAVYSALASFRPLTTRLQNIGTFRGVTFYQDTLATIPEATIAAIDTLHPATLIAGGHDRRQDYSHLAQKIVGSGVRTLILFPATGPRIAQEVQKYSATGPHILPAQSMEEAVRLAYTHTAPGQICLLSPAAPSFTLFKDYTDEGDQYQKFVTLFASTS